MTENGLTLQTVTIKQTDFQSNRVSSFRLVRKKKEKFQHSLFLKFLLASRTKGTFVVCHHKNQSFAKTKEFFSTQH
ncbi:MAG: hypothetical protein IPG55_16615 [Saprospiraceae bacterium]|nr:hypothetical protein [Candidatus Defluviibacterium haderslevense]